MRYGEKLLKKFKKLLFFIKIIYIRKSDAIYNRSSQIEKKLYEYLLNKKYWRTNFLELKNIEYATILYLKDNKVKEFFYYNDLNLVVDEDGILQKVGHYESFFYEEIILNDEDNKYYYTNSKGLSSVVKILGFYIEGEY